MTDAQKAYKALQDRAGEIRVRCLQIAQLETASVDDAIETEERSLRDELQGVETKLIAARTAATDEGIVETRDLDQTDVELRELLKDSSIGRVAFAEWRGQQVDGREAELQQHLGLRSNEIPIAMLESRAVTPAPSDTGTTQAPIIQPIFGHTAAAFLNIPMPSVPVGSATFPVLTSKPTVETPAEGVSIAADTPAGAFSADLLSAQYASAAFEYSREDASRFEGMGAALTMALQSGLGFEIDRQILRHAAEGLLTAGLTVPGNPAAESGYASYLKALNGQVDGITAASAMDCRILVGSATYAHSDSKYRTATSNISALDALMAKSGGVRVHSEVPAVAAKRQDAIIAKGLGEQHAVLPLWPSVALVVDEITKVKTRVVILTALLGFAFKVLRSDGFARVRFQVEA